MSSVPVSVREGTDADIPAVLALMRRSLGEGNIPRAPSFWAWKHQENPFGRSPFHLAEVDGQLVGVRVFMRWRWQLGARSLPAVRAVDTATDPAFQGKGIFRKLTLGLVDQMQREGVSFVFNTPNDKSRPGYLKMGWSSLGRVSLWMRPVGLRGTRRILGRLLARARTGEPEAECESSAAAGSAVPAPVASSVFTPPWSSKLHTPKDAPYLDWRYSRCPAFGYRFDVADRAVVVSRERARFGLRELTVCDVLFERSRAGIAGAREALTAALASSGADYAICALHADPFTVPVLARAGFLPAPKAGPVLTVRPFEAGVERVVLERRAWAPSIGDLELF